MWMPPEQINCAHDHTGGAITALQSVVVAKCCLHGMHGAVCLGEAFNGYDRAAVRLPGEHVAAFDRLTIDIDGTGAALCGIAPDMRPGQAQCVADEVHQQS